MLTCFPQPLCIYLVAVMAYKQLSTVQITVMLCIQHSLVVHLKSFKVSLHIILLFWLQVNMRKHTWVVQVHSRNLAYDTTKLVVDC